MASKTHDSSHVFVFRNQKKILSKLKLWGCVIKSIPDRTGLFYSNCTECSECGSPACLFTSAASKVNKHRTWPCCWETRGACIKYMSNRPDDALMYAGIGNVAQGKIRRRTHEGWVTLTMTGSEAVMGGADYLSERDSLWTPSEGRSSLGFMLAVCLECFQYISSAVTSHFEINYATSSSSIKTHRMHSPHIPAHVVALRNVFVRKASHKPSDTF